MVFAHYSGSSLSPQKRPISMTMMMNWTNRMTSLMLAEQRSWIPPGASTHATESSPVCLGLIAILTVRHPA